jgi:hypothetical protein
MKPARLQFRRHVLPFLVLPATLIVAGALIGSIGAGTTLAPMTLVVALCSAVPMSLGFAIDSAASRGDAVNPEIGRWLAVAGTIAGLLGGIDLVGLHVSAGGEPMWAGLTFFCLTLGYVILGLIRDRHSVAYAALIMTGLMSLADTVHWPLLVVCALLALITRQGWQPIRRWLGRLPLVRYSVFTRRPSEP